MNAEDRALLDFDEGVIEDYDRAEAEARLAGEHGDTYRTHLIAARWVEQWSDSLDRERGPDINAEEVTRRKGVVWGLREVAAHLRLGDFLPGAGPYEQAKP